jgi:hypothetical protein
MSEPEKKSSGVKTIVKVAVCLSVGMLLVVATYVYIAKRENSSAQVCIIHLHQIDGAKHSWALEHGAKPGDMVTTNDIAPFLRPETLTCPAGGIFTAGKIGEPPICSLGTTVTPAHVLP